MDRDQQHVDLNLQLEAVVGQLEVARTRAELNEGLDALAKLAKHHDPALEQLLTEVVERDLIRLAIGGMFLRADALEVAVQETLVALVRNVGSFRGDALFLTWLDRVAANEVKQLKRRQGRKSEPVSSLVPDQPAPGRRISSLASDRVDLEQALLRLSPDHRQVLYLREFEQLSYQQIAERIGERVGTVRSRLARGRAELDALLSDWPDRP